MIPTLFLIMGWGFQPERVSGWDLFVLLQFVDLSSFDNQL